MLASHPQELTQYTVRAHSVETRHDLGRQALTSLASVGSAGIARRSLPLPGRQVPDHRQTWPKLLSITSPHFEKLHLRTRSGPRRPASSPVPDS